MKDLNFFAPYMQEPVKKSSSTAIVVLLSVLVVLGCAGLAGLNYLTISNLNASIVDLDMKLNDPQFIAKVNAVQKKKDELQSLQADELIFEALDIVMDKQSKVNEAAVKLIANQLPNELFLTDLGIKRFDVDLTGKAYSELAVAQFQYNLRLTEEFNNIFVSGVNKNESYYNFDIKLQAKEDGANENQQ